MLAPVLRTFYPFAVAQFYVFYILEYIYVNVYLYNLSYYYKEKTWFYHIHTNFSILPKNPQEL